MCQPMPTGLYTRRDIDSETSRFTPQQKKTRSFENIVLTCFQRTRPDIVKLRASTLQADRRKLSASVLMGFVLAAILCLKLWVAFTNFARVTTYVLLSLKRIFNVCGSKKRKPDELSRG